MDAPRLADLVEHPERVADVPLDAMPSLLLELATLHTALAARLATPTNGSTGADSDDRLLNVSEAATMLNVSEDFLYRSPEARPFRVKIGGRVMFSYRKAQTFIARRAGRE